MKKNIIGISLIIAFLSCSSQSESEKAITAFLQTKDGVTTDLKIEFIDVNISDVTVLDSISIMEKDSEIQKQQRIKKAEKDFTHWQKTIDEHKSKNTRIGDSFAKNYNKNLEKAKADLEAANNWKADNLTKYNSRDEKEVLIKKAETKFSFFNPRLQTRQEMQVLFILSPDGKECYTMIKD